MLILISYFLHVVWVENIVNKLIEIFLKFDTILTVCKLIGYYQSSKSKWISNVRTAEIIQKS